MKLLLAAFAALAISAITPAQHHAMGAKHPMMAMMSTHDCCMQGLSAAERKAAASMMSKWSSSERMAWDHRCSFCMKDPHPGMMEMMKEHKMPSADMVHQHMMGGLSKSDQKAMNMILADKKNNGLVMKMVENCCMYGAKHAGHGGK